MGRNRLMLCAGSGRRPGWKTLDISGADFNATIPPLPPEVRAIQWDEIELIHGITSFYPWEAAKLLAEIQECLTSEGRIVLEQPNVEYVLGDLASGRGALSWLFGDPHFQNPAHMNKWAYSPRTLRCMLEYCGFSLVDECPAQHHNPQRDFRMEAYR